MQNTPSMPKYIRINPHFRKRSEFFKKTILYFLIFINYIMLYIQIIIYTYIFIQFDEWNCSIVYLNIYTYISIYLHVFVFYIYIVFFSLSLYIYIYIYIYIHICIHICIVSIYRRLLDASDLVSSATTFARSNVLADLSLLPPAHATGAQA